jgi:GT2 family glycosyltransferase
MSHAKTPIAVFLYNRPAHARLVLESLSRCHRFDECSLRIFCDGAKRAEHSAGVAETREVAREWATRLNAALVEREMNLGLARSIVGGVSELCDEYGRVIVVEDDFVLNPSFLDYMLSALDRYAGEPNVYQVSGYMYPIRHAPQPDAFFLPLTTTWGWATWARAWQIFNWNASDAEALLRDPEVRRRFDLNNAYPYAEMLERQLRGEIDSWGILFWWAVFKANGLVLHPRKSLVWNGGFDQSGTHCGDQAWSTQSLAEIANDTWAASSFQFPQQVAADELAFGKVIQFLWREQSQGSLVERIRRRVRQTLRRRETERVHANNG